MEWLIVISKYLGNFSFAAARTRRCALIEKGQNGPFPRQGVQRSIWIRDWVSLKPAKGYLKHAPRDIRYFFLFSLLLLLLLFFLFWYPSLVVNSAICLSRLSRFPFLKSKGNESVSIIKMNNIHKNKQPRVLRSQWGSRTSTCRSHPATHSMDQSLRKWIDIYLCTWKRNYPNNKNNQPIKSFCFFCSEKRITFFTLI